MTLLTIWMLFCVLFSTTHHSEGQETGLPEYVVSECYGDIFNFDCGPGNKIRINRDFFGYSSKEGCRYRRGDCIISNPKSNSLIHRFCTGQRVCTYYMVERRGCGGYFSNYQQVEYQCIPDTSVTDICSTTEYSATSTYIASPNFPQNYPPKKNCNCVVTAADSDAKVQMEIVYLAIKYTQPCRDWLSIGRKKTCGTSLDLFQGKSIPIGFHSDTDESHSGFWLHFQSSVKGGKVVVKCGNVTSTLKPEKKRKPSKKDKDDKKADEDFRQGAIEGKEATVVTTLSPPSTMSPKDGPDASDLKSYDNPKDPNTKETDNSETDKQDISRGNGDPQDPPVVQGDRAQQGGNSNTGRTSNPWSIDPSLTALAGESPGTTGESSQSSPPPYTYPSSKSPSDDSIIFNQGDPEGKQGRPLSQTPSATSTSSSDPRTTLDSGPIASPKLAKTDSDDGFGVQTSTVPSINLLGGNPNRGYQGDSYNTVSETDADTVDGMIIQDPALSENPNPNSNSNSNDNVALTVDTNDLDLDLENENDDLDGLFDIIEIDDLNSESQNPTLTENLHNSNKQNQRLSDVSDRNSFSRDVNKNKNDNEKELIDREVVIVETGGDGQDDSETFVDITDIEVVNRDKVNRDNVLYNKTNIAVSSSGNKTRNGTSPAYGPGIVENSRKEEHGIITFGLIILCICIGVGIVLIVLVLLIVYCRRRRRCTVNEETQTQGISKHTSTSISDADGDSGQGLLTAHNANGTGIVVEVASLYTKPAHKADIGLQIDLFDDEYDDVIVFEDLSFDGSESEDNSSVCGNLCYEPNDKAVQVTSPIKILDAGGGKLRNRPVRRKQRVLQVTSSASITDGPYSENDECHSGSDMSSECVAGLCITDSDLDDFSGSEGDIDSVRKESIASMSELSEVTMVPQNALVGMSGLAEVTMVPQNALVGMYDPTLEPDWDKRSGISI